MVSCRNTFKTYGKGENEYQEDECQKDCKEESTKDCEEAKHCKEECKKRLRVNKSAKAGVKKTAKKKVMRVNVVTPIA
jgi:hypothetical protein